MSDLQITTNSNKADRAITVDKPEILLMKDVADFVGALGEDLVVNILSSGLTVSFRSHIRTKLESKTDDEFTNTDEAILEMDFTDWKPEARTRKSVEEKAADLLGKLSPEQIQAALAKAGLA